MGKTRDLFKEITDAKGTYHAKMLSIKVRNIMDLTETEGKHKMGKTRDLKKFRDTKGIFYAKMGSIKDRNGMDLTEAEDIEKR